MTAWTQTDFVILAYAVTTVVLLVLAVSSLRMWWRYRADYRRLFERRETDK